jgi:hypothetical protein
MSFPLGIPRTMASTSRCRGIRHVCIKASWFCVSSFSRHDAAMCSHLLLATYLPKMAPVLRLLPLAFPSTHWL